MKITNLTKKEINELISNNNSINQILKSINVNSNGSGAYRTFRNHCDKLGVILPKYKHKNFKIGNKIPLNEILIENSTYQNVSRLKIRLINENILEYKCVKCGNEGEWMGEAIVLQLDHKNGIRNDNRVENLRFMCPNCHSQTPTFSGKNKK